MQIERICHTCGRVIAFAEEGQVSTGDASELPKGALCMKSVNFGVVGPAAAAGAAAATSARHKDAEEVGEGVEKEGEEGRKREETMKERAEGM